MKKIVIGLAAIMCGIALYAEDGNCHENCARAMSRHQSGCSTILSGQPYGGYPGGGYGGPEAMYTAYQACMDQARQYYQSCFVSCD